MGVSMNGGTPKWDVFSNGKSHLEMDDLVPPYYNSICRGPPIATADARLEKVIESRSDELKNIMEKHQAKPAPKC